MRSVLIGYSNQPDQALVVAKQRADSRYDNILNSVQTIVFFATPHSGCRTAGLVELYARALQVSRAKADPDLVKELQPNSDNLFDLGKDFVQVMESHRLVIYTFFEMKKMPIGDKEYVVSATPCNNPAECLSSLHRLSMSSQLGLASRMSECQVYMPTTWISAGCSQGALR